MNLTDNTNNVIEELKKEIILLRRENSDLSAECARLQEVANDALRQNHPESEHTFRENSNFSAAKELLESENSTIKVFIEKLGIAVSESEMGLGATGIDLIELKLSEKILAQERELFEGIFNNIPVLITLYDPEFKNFRFNTEMKRILGWTEEDASDGNFLEKVYPDPDYRQKVTDYMKSLKSGWQEYTVTAKDGKKVISSWANILLNSGIQIGIGIDIRDRKKSELKIRENEQRLQGIFNNAAIGIVEIDLNDRFILVNDRICQILGYSRSELLNKTLLDITVPEDRENTSFLYQQLHHAKADIINYEKKYLKSDGTSLWVHVSVSAIRDSNGKQLKSIGTIEDISERKQYEKALQDSEERFRMLADNISQMVWIYDKDGLPLWFNKRWIDFTGVGIEEIKNGAHIKVNHPDDIERVMNGFSKSVISGTPWEDTYRMRSKEEEDRWFLSYAMPIYDTDGMIMNWFGTSTDITGQKLAEEDALLRATEMEAILSCIADGVIVYNKEGQITRSNAAADHILYNKPDEIVLNIGKRNFEIWTEDGKKLNPEETPAYRASVNAETTRNQVYLFQRKGESRWINISAAPLFVSGILSGAVVSMSNITDRKNVEEALRLSEEKFRLLFENITEGVALHEVIYENGNAVNYKIINVNRAFEQNCGLQAEMAVGSLATQLYGTQKPPYLNEYLTVATTRKPLRFETYFPSLNKHFIINVVSPKEGQFATVFEDITDQKRNEQEIKQKNEELTRFIYTVSHDLKSPLVTIKSFASFIKSDIAIDDKEALDRDIMYIQNAANKMGNLLDELLELSRIGRKEDVKVKVPLREIAQSAIDLVAGRISNGKVEIRFVGPPVMLYGHSQRLIQLYQNLLDNAVKFIGNQSRPLVEIGTTIEEEKVILFVRDNGAGIDARYHHKIFGLFEKLDNSKEGTGIGLALVKRIVEVHGGNIWFDSEGPEKGTTFYFTLEGIYAI